MSFRLLVSCLVLMSVGIPPPATAQDKQQVKAELVAQIANLQGTEINLKNAAAAIAKQATSLNEQQAVLKPQFEAWNSAREAIVNETARYHTEVDTHNSRCDGAFSDQAHVNICNNKKRDLDAWKAAAIRRAAQNNLTRASLVEQAQTIVRKRNEMVSAHTSNSQALAKVAGQIATLQEAVRKLNLDDSFLNDPRARQQLSVNCMAISDIEERVECMKRIFDGGAR